VPQLGSFLAPPRAANGRTGATRTGARHDAFAAFQFKVDLGHPGGIAMFSECSGLELTVKYDEIKEGGNNGFVHRLPGRVEYGNLVLRRGYTNDSEFFDWCSAALRGKVERRMVTVSLVALDTGQPVFSWTFVDAYPVKWSGPSLRSTDSTMAVESLELAHRGLQVEAT
jgi:phage tail-like protein